MRIHEVLDACIEYVAYEGVLGSDVLRLQEHLAKRDSYLDATSFAYIYTLLCQHPSIRIAISTYPLGSTGESLQLGSAPLPADYSPPEAAVEVDFNQLYSEGKRGREMAFHLAGEQHKTSKEAVAVKRADQERNRLGKRAAAQGEDAKGKGKGGQKGLDQIKGEDGTVLFTFLDEDDAELGGDPVDKTDLAGLAAKWGSRLRIRCTDDEVYFRLTGSHQKIPKLTLPVLHMLQLAARSREKGITAIELGPMVGASQGSTFYYMKVLTDAGLCAKVPAVLHGSITNLLVFHPFLELNENYRAIKKLGPLPGSAPAPAPTSDPAPAEDEDDPAIDDNGGTGLTGFDFRPITEPELMNGHIVKERLLQLLDHPALQNHLLKARNLLAMITLLRHRRAMTRVLASLVMNGVVERLAVGPKRVDCLRLTKFNPDYKGPPKPSATVQEEVVVSTYSPQDFIEPYSYAGAIAMTRTLERQIIDVVVQAGQEGVTYSDIHDALHGVYKRVIEFYFVRGEDMRLPPAMLESAYCSVIEFAGKERRLRMFTVPAYRTYMLANGQPLDDAKHPPTPPEAGRWACLKFRKFVPDAETFWHEAEETLTAIERDSKIAHFYREVKTARRKDAGTRKPRKSDGKPTKRARSPDLEADPSAPPTKAKKQTLYNTTIQVRGRPRKYIHVVDEEGTVKRLIIGQVLPHPSLPPVLIWVKSVKKLVPAPAEYSGLGKPPPVTAEQLKLGHTPAFYDKFARGKSSKKKGKKGSKGKEESEEEPEEDGDKEELVELIGEKATEVDELDSQVGEAEGAEDVPSSASAPVEAAVPADAPAKKGRPRKQPSASVEASAAPSKQGRPRSQSASVAPQPAVTDSVASTSQLPTSAVADIPNAPPRRRGRGRKNLTPVAPSEALGDVASPSQTTRPKESTAPEAGDTDDVVMLEADPSKKRARSAAASPPAKRARRGGKEQAEAASGSGQPTQSEFVAPNPASLWKSLVPVPIVAAATRAPASPTVPKRRVDMGLISRSNELVEALRAYGPVMSDTKLQSAHREWTYAVAGTDAPFAPALGYKMDRRVFKEGIRALETDGRIRTTMCSIPTTTGRWIQQQVIWLPDTAQTEIDNYISKLSDTTSASLQWVPKRAPRRQVEEQAFTEAKVAGQVSISAKTIVIRRALKDDSPATLRRNALIKQPGVAATLLGYISGRWVRVRRLFEALVETIPTSRSSISHNVFALPLIFEDIPVGTFYQCIFSTSYDEDLDQWLSEPENTKTRLKDVPHNFRPVNGFAGAGTKAKYRTLLNTLCLFGLLSPLRACDAEDADVTVPGPINQYFKVPDAVTQATHFVVHKHAPVYHIAADPAGLLGMLPISTAAERDIYWSVTRDACVERDPKALPPLQSNVAVGLPHTARITSTLEPDTDTLRLMRSGARWRSDIRILEEQRAAIDAQIDWRRGVPKITSDEDIEAFAYENALSITFVRDELVRRARQAQDRATRIAQQEVVTAKALQERRARNQRSLREKLAEMRTTTKREWENRILQACEVAGVTCTSDVINFVTHHTLTLPNRSNLSDAAIQDAVRLSTRVKPAQARVEREVAVAAKRKELQDRQPPKSLPVKGQRRRHEWTPKEDDLLLDVEAIVRARSRGRARGRQAVLQVFPDVGHQTFLHRFKKIIATAGKQQYFERLEQAWYDVWMAHRGMGELIDEDPDSTADFDLKHHVEFLRSHIRKQDLRLGIVARRPEVKIPDLPASHADVVQQEWTYAKVEQPTLYHVNEAGTSDETKLAGFGMVPLKHEPKEMRSGSMDRSRGLLRACLKVSKGLAWLIQMVVSTPNEIYDQPTATAFLACYPTQSRMSEVNNLVDERAFVKQNSASATSRYFGYSNTWNTYTDGPMPGEMFSEARAMEEKLETEDMEWRGLCSAGEIAALLEMTSDGVADIDFDYKEFRPVRYLRSTYNTRQLDDTAFEFDYNVVKVKDAPSTQLASLPVPHLGPTIATWLDQYEDVHAEVNHVLDLVHAAGPDGLTRAQLDANYPSSTLFAVFASLAADSPPEVFWAGYDTPRLISTQHWEDWTHAVPRKNIRVRPRRWVDIFGEMLKEDWERCLKCAVGYVMVRPGVLTMDLRSRMGIVMDRMEVNEVLQYLEERGNLRRAWIGGGGVIPPIEAMSSAEEGMVGYWPGRTWGVEF